MKFKLSGEIKFYASYLEIEGNNIDDAIVKLTEDAESLGRALVDTDADAYDISVSEDYDAEVYEKEIDVTISDIEWEGVSKEVVEKLPKEFHLVDVSIDNVHLQQGVVYVNPIDEESENSCIKETLVWYIKNTYQIKLKASNIRSFTKEITNEQ